ncbi:MAG: ATP-binding protein, partial [Candidatus Dormibacteraceae bacterium]
AGSTQFLAIPTLSESLAGRVGFINLWGLSVAERCGYTGNFCDLAFNDPAAFVDSNSHWQRKDYIKAVIQGGYPELLPMPATANARHTWFTGYLTTIVERDISSFAEIERISALQAILKLVAARAGSLVVQSDLARSLQLNRETVRNYLGYLELVFLLATIPSWSNNLSSRIARTPKTYVTDSGLAAHLLGVEAQALATPGHSALGGLLETFVLSEIMKLQSVADTPFEIHHYRERDDREIDLILEDRQGRVVAIEVKASVSPPAGAARHLHWLGDRLGDRLRAGILLHLGPQGGSLGDRIYSLPVSSLWGNTGHGL